MTSCEVIVVTHVSGERELHVAERADRRSPRQRIDTKRTGRQRTGLGRRHGATLLLTTTVIKSNARQERENTLYGFARACVVRRAACRHA